MAKAPAGPARLYVTTRTDTPFQVVYTDPTQREKSGRAKRIAKWFAVRKDAEDFQADLNKQLVTEGTAGVQFTSALRADALAEIGTNGEAIAGASLFDLAGASIVTVRRIAMNANANAVGTGRAEAGVVTLRSAPGSTARVDAASSIDLVATATNLAPGAGRLSYQGTSAPWRSLASCVP